MSVFGIIAWIAVVPEIIGGAHFLKGDQAEREQSRAFAASCFLECAQQSDFLRPYALLRAAKNHFMAQQMEAGDTLLQQTTREYPEGPWTRLIHAQRGDVFHAQQNWETAHAQYDQALAGLSPVPWFLNDLAWRNAECALKTTHQAADGYAYFRHIAETSLIVKQRKEASLHLLNSADSEDRCWGIYGLTRSGNLREAREALNKENVSFQDVSNPALPLADLDAAICNPAGSATDALASIENHIRSHTDSRWMRVWLMVALREQAGTGKYETAELLAQLLARHFSEGRDAGDAFWFLAERYETGDRKRDALRMYRLLTTMCPDHVRAPRSLYYLANHARETGSANEAYRLYDALGKAHPNSSFAAEGYYRAAQLAAKEKNEAKEQIYLTRASGVGIGHFYAHRALHLLRTALDVQPAHTRALKIDGRDDFLQPFPMPEQIPYAPSPQIKGTAAWQRLQFFGIHGLEEGEWEALECMLSAPRELETCWYSAIADAGFMHTLLQNVAARGWGLEQGHPTSARLRIEYPPAYWPKVYSISQELNLDPYLLLAIAKQESTFRAGVVSSAGATGVLQLMPSTAKWLAEVDHRIALEQVQHLKSPFNSIRLGAVYLHRMLSRSQNNLVFALASYNAGPGNCDKWRARFPNYGAEEFMEAIPFSETNDYVKKVLANYLAYHSLYPMPDTLNTYLQK